MTDLGADLQQGVRRCPHRPPDLESRSCGQTPNASGRRRDRMTHTGAGAAPSRAWPNSTLSPSTSPASVSFDPTVEEHGPDAVDESTVSRPTDQGRGEGHEVPRSRLRGSTGGVRTVGEAGECRHRSPRYSAGTRTPPSNVASTVAENEVLAYLGEGMACPGSRGTARPARGHERDDVGVSAPPGKIDRLWRSCWVVAASTATSGSNWANSQRSTAWSGQIRGERYRP